ncbi:MAG: carboxypeptidase regulatory-like domain-containing protein [Chloroflexi bacterium]|nr:MAG: carboxypeptidase regulatory-like domain-containing protein [Chloroflexota bacterium]TME48609.1 MAG: carboxypeptidase regulatory-like domain-containing protein [Chloroflexota bacterium]
MMLRRAWLAMLALLLCGCAAGPAIFGPSTGTVAGHVTIRACGGAYRIDQNGCRVSAAAGARLTLSLAGSSESATATTDAGGAFRMTLKPGTYGVHIELQGSPAAPASSPNSAAARGFAGPKQVTVSAGKTVKADFTYTIELL